MYASLKQSDSSKSYNIHISYPMNKICMIIVQ